MGGGGEAGPPWPPRTPTTLTRKKHRQIKLQLLLKYEYGQLIRRYSKSTLVIRGSWNRTKFPKNKIVTGKTPFFVICPFCTHHSICLIIGFCLGSFVWKWCVSSFGLSIKKRYSSFLKKVFIFQKNCFKVKSIENVSNFHWLSQENKPIPQTEGYF